MWHKIGTIIGGLLLTVSSWFPHPVQVPQNLGATVTSTNLSDTINTFRTNVNGSLTALNTELGVVSSTVHAYGTIVAYNSPLPVANGGTGTSTSPSNNQFLSASGTAPTWKTLIAGSGLSSTSTGTTFTLSSQGIDTTQNFSWSGSHTFTSSTVLSGSTTVSGVTTITGTTTVNGNRLLPNFGGTGADGALSISSGTSTIALGSASVVVKNYTSISITGTGSLTFSGAATNGTIVILKSQGVCTFTSSAATAINASGFGATGGAGPATGAGNSGGIFGFWDGATEGAATGGGAAAAGSRGGGGGGGSSISTAGSTGNNGTGAGTGGAGGTSPMVSSTNLKYIKAFVLPGAGGASGGTGNNNSSNTAASGGIGGGALYIECGGALNSTATLVASGLVGSAATGGNSGGGGGGGGGGTIVILYNSLTANSGTYTVAGGSGGAGDTGGGTGGAGATGNTLITQNTEF